MTSKFIDFFNANYSFQKKYRDKTFSIKQNGSNKYVTPAEVFQAYIVAALKNGETVNDITMAEVEQWVNETMPKAAEEEERKPPREYIHMWMKAYGRDWKLSRGWKTIQYSRGGVPTNWSLEELREAIMDTIYTEKLPYKIDEIKTALNVIVREENQDTVLKIFEKIAYNEKSVEKGEKFLRKLYDYFAPTESFEIMKTIMYHWGWICKRRMLGLRVKWHIWPNFCGDTGLGKTTTIKKLCSPMDEYVCVTKISTLWDSTKEVGKLTSNYVLIFDELSINSDGDQHNGVITNDQKATLKSILTEDELPVRVYGTQKQNKPKITFAPISTANYHLYDIIYDPTSMRRFFEFHCEGKRPTDQFKAINEVLKYAYIWWQSIDENREEGYWDPSSDIGKEIEAMQMQYYPTDTTTSKWVKACGVKAGKQSPTGAYHAYQSWCKLTGHPRPRNMENWVEDIKHYIPDSVDLNGIVRLEYRSPFDMERELNTQPSAEVAEPLESILGTQGVDDDDLVA